MKMLLVEDHMVVREGVRRLLEGLDDVIIREAENGQTALAAFRKEAFDLVLLDLNLPGISGLELLKRFLLEDASAKVLVFTMHAEAIYAARALEAGACGYVSKSAAADELLTAVERIINGGRYIERELAVELAVGQATNEGGLGKLTTREIDILRLLGEGRSLTEIARTLNVAYKTIANSCSLMKGKLGVERTADLIRLSIETRRG